MPRLIEIVLFLVPFIGFAAWRLLAPSPLPPPWLIYGLTAFFIVMIAALLWFWHLENENAGQPYIPDRLQNGVAVPGHPP
jgi:drug/metabolite transporter (DMT)-like permease